VVVDLDQHGGRHLIGVGQVGEHPHPGGAIGSPDRGLQVQDQAGEQWPELRIRGGMDEDPGVANSISEIFQVDGSSCGVGAGSEGTGRWVSGQRPTDDFDVGAITDPIGGVRTHGCHEELDQRSAEDRGQAAEHVGIGDLDCPPLDLGQPAHRPLNLPGKLRPGPVLLPAVAADQIGDGVSHGDWMDTRTRRLRSPRRRW